MFDVPHARRFYDISTKKGPSRPALGSCREALSIPHWTVRLRKRPGIKQGGGARTALRVGIRG